MPRVFVLISTFAYVASLSISPMRRWMVSDPLPPSYPAMPFHLATGSPASKASSTVLSFSKFLMVSGTPCFVNSQALLRPMSYARSAMRRPSLTKCEAVAASSPYRAAVIQSRPSAGMSGCSA